MTVKKLVTPERFVGLSVVGGDTKPTDGATSVRPGATFHEYDTGNLYITYDGTNWVLKAIDGMYIGDIKFGESLPAGSAAIGKLAANSGVDIGDVDVTSVIPGTGATNLGKAEDAAHTSGDSGVMLLGVRKDAAAALAGTDGDYVPIIVDAYGRLHTAPLVSVVHTEHPFGKGALTSTGVQWSATTDTTTADTDVTIEAAKTIEPPAAGTIVEVEFGLTGGFKAVSSATADIIYKWQARDKGGTWVTLVSVTKTNIGTTEVEETYSGRFATVANFDAVPFDVQLVIQCNETNEGRARIKNSSYVKVIYNPS